MNANDSSSKSGENWDDNDIDKKVNMTALDIDVESPATDALPLPSSDSNGNCFSRVFNYGGISEAKGYALLAMGRGAAVMSNST